MALRNPYNSPVRTVTLDVVLDELLASEKTAKIHTDPKTFFVHVRVPDAVAAELRAVQRRVLPDTTQHADIDHVTLVYTQKPTEDHPPEKVHAAVEALRQVGAQTPPIHAQIQGWGHFDGASKAGKPNTALVALLDAPGLEHLHVDMTRALKTHGIAPSTTHVFTPHITLGYLGAQGRTAAPLPAINGRFTIDRAHIAARDHHDVPLTATAKTAWVDRLPGGLSDTKTPQDFPPRALAQGHKVEQEHTRDAALATEIAMDHLTEDPAYYTKLKQIEKGASLGVQAAKFAKGDL